VPTAAAPLSRLETFLGDSWLISVRARRRFNFFKKKGVVPCFFLFSDFYLGILRIYLEIGPA